LWPFRIRFDGRLSVFRKRFEACLAVDFYHQVHKAPQSLSLQNIIERMVFADQERMGVSPLSRLCAPS